MLTEIASIARSADAWILCDEVYRGTDQDGSGMTASIADIYEKGISTASMSKAFSLAGLRLGWIAAPVEIIEAVSLHRDYDTISVGIIDDYFATLALEHKDKILARSRTITSGNLQVLEDWVAQQPLISSWTIRCFNNFAIMPGKRFKIPAQLNSQIFCSQLSPGNLYSTHQRPN